MIKRSHTPLKRRVRGTEILRRQSSKRSILLRKYKDGPILSTVIKAGDAVKGRLFRSSSLPRGQRLLMSSGPGAAKNWFKRLLDRARDVLGDPNSHEMTRLRVKYEYDLSLRLVEENYEL